MCGVCVEKSEIGVRTPTPTQIISGSYQLIYTYETIIILLLEKR